MNKTARIVSIIILVAIIGLVISFRLTASKTAQVPQPAVSATENATNAQAAAVGSSSGTDTTTTSQAPGTYTLAQIATHKDATSCWTTINGGVYDVTSWINQHPGGPDKILSLCGTDGSAAFNGQHGGQARPASELASFKIGTLAQ